MSKFNPLSKHRLSSSTPSTPSTPSSSDSSAPNSTSALKVSSPFNPRSSPSSTPNSRSSSKPGTPKSSTSIPPKDKDGVVAPQIQATASASSDTSKSGVIATTSNFFRRRARSFSSAARKEREERERAGALNGNGNTADQQENIVVASPISEGQPGLSSTPPSLSEATSNNTIVPSRPFRARGVVHSRSPVHFPERLSQSESPAHRPQSLSTAADADSRSSSRTPRSETAALSQSKSKSQSQSRSRSRGRTQRDESPGPLDLEVKSLDSVQPHAQAHEKEKEQLATHHHAFGLPMNWWDHTPFEVVHRPWGDPNTDVDPNVGSTLFAQDDAGKGKGKGREPKRRGTVGSVACAMPEQAEGWDLTRQRVAVAARSVLGTTLDITHEALLTSVDLLDLAPVPGLAIAARTLLNVWDCLQKVDMNRMACLRLTQRCADILISVRQEVQDAGGDVGEELRAPIAKLTESFDMVYNFLLKQVDRPFLKRYLRRDEILRQIAGCDASLSDSVNTFSLSIQIRILKQVQALNFRIASGPTGAPPPAYIIPKEEPAGHSTPTSTPVPSNPTEIRTRLHAFRQQENERDAGLDLVDLRQLMRTALQTSNDAQMIEVLQVGRDEMPEAMKTLQRALEREVEKESALGSAGGSSHGTGGSVTMSPVEAGEVQSSAVVVAGGRRASVPLTGVPEADGLGRRMTLPDTGSSMEVGASESMIPSGNGNDGRARDMLDREFIETGIDALRRISHGHSLPSWTITKYEVDLDEKIGKIGIGYFSTVYKGTWRKRTVAIKVLATTTPRQLFTHEIAVWKNLYHPNVLELFGASSAIGEPPWFFVSPYCENGSLVTWLRSMRSGDEVDMLRCMHQIAKGMEYLHNKGVLHGDLKGANVLVDDNKRCLVSDFGQSEMRSEAYRLSGTPPPHGTLRWQAPEVMSGTHNRLTQETDVYAFSICCVEILDKGAMPWQHQDDSAIVRFVVEDNKRPTLSQTRVSSLALTNLIQSCWDRDPSLRPSFKRIAADLKHLRIKSGAIVDEPESHPVTFGDPQQIRLSPDMRPNPLPGANVSTVSEFQLSAEDSSRPVTSDDSIGKALSRPRVRTDQEFSMPQRVLYTPSLNSSQASSIFDSSDGNLSSVAEEPPPDLDGYDSPLPANDRIAEARNERRYRMFLNHDFHPSLTLPLWTPSSVGLGDVGYLDKPSGAFVTLFNAFSPEKSSIVGLPSLYGYGRITRGEQRQDKRGAARRGLDALAGFLTFKSYSQSVSRRYSYQLRDGHKTAYLCTESTKYRYVEDLDTPKKWFKANVDSVMQEFGQEHRIQKEDLFLVIGTLDVPDYALFVSHKHPDGQVHFNVFSAPKPGQLWGAFTTDTELPSELGGPSYHEEIPGNSMANSQSANKISISGAPSATVLVARLRFKPDVSDPTSL